MVEILKQFCISQKNACIYTNRYDTETFHYGRILAANAKETALGLLLPNGTPDGILVIATELIYRIETDGQYNKKMERLTMVVAPNEPVELNNEQIAKSLLEIAFEENLLVSLELFDSGNYDMIGYITNISEYTYTLKLFDDYGIEDGVAIVLADSVSKIRCQSEDEVMIQKLITQRLD